MKRVFVCSAFGGLAENLERARTYCQAEIDAGHAPLAPHLLYPQMLDEHNPAERALGLELGLTWLAQCDALHVYLLEGQISAGMALEIDWAERLGIPVRYFPLEEV